MGKNVGTFRIIVAAVAGSVCCLCHVWPMVQQRDLWVSWVNSAAELLRLLPVYCLCHVWPMVQQRDLWVSWVNSADVLFVSCLADGAARRALSKFRRIVAAVAGCVVCVMFGQCQWCSSRVGVVGE